MFRQRIKLLTALIKRVEKIGSVCCFEKINSQIIEKYVAKWANENGKLISHLNASKIISNVGDDLNLLKNEVNKIAVQRVRKYRP